MLPQWLLLLTFTHDSDLPLLALALGASQFALTFIVHFILCPSHQVIWQHLVVHGQLGHLHAAALPVSRSTASHPPAQELFASGRKHGSQVSQQVDAAHVNTFAIFNNNDDKNNNVIKEPNIYPVLFSVYYVHYPTESTQHSRKKVLLLSLGLSNPGTGR